MKQKILKEMFIRKLTSDLKGVKTDKIDYYSFEDNWNKGNEIYPTEEQGNCISITDKLHMKYYNEVLESYK